MVLTDLEMPEMDGFTLTRQMKEDDALKGLFPWSSIPRCPGRPTNRMPTGWEPMDMWPNSFPMNWRGR